MINDEYISDEGANQAVDQRLADLGRQQVDILRQDPPIETLEREIIAMERGFLAVDKMHRQRKMAELREERAATTLRSLRPAGDGVEIQFKGETTIEQLTTLVSVVQKEMNSYREKTKTLTSDLEAQAQKVASLHLQLKRNTHNANKLASYRDQLRVTLGELKFRTDQVASLREQLKRRANHTEVREELEYHKAKQTEWDAQQDLLNQHIKCAATIAEREHAELASKIKAVEEDFESLRLAHASCADAQARAASLEQRVSALQEDRGKWRSRTLGTASRKDGRAKERIQIRRERIM
ncbi:hypothetical protein ACEQ8H_006262 [Pleosporales sp. CAS-2024a]